MTTLLLILTPGLPILAVLVFCSARRWIPAMPLMAVSPLPALLLSILGTSEPLAVFPGWTLILDETARMLLAPTAALWLFAGLSTSGRENSTTHRPAFVVCWLLTLSGSLTVFIATGYLSFLTAYAFASIPALGLVLAKGTSESRRAGKTYLGFALLGENLLIPALALMALGIPASQPVVLLGLLVGFGIKMALIPFHSWMPLSHGAAPVPASAILSGAAVKAGVIGMLRFLPFDTASPSWGVALSAIGFAGAFWGVAAGLCQTHPKTLLAYSTVSQMGFLAGVMGAGLSAGDPSIVPLVAFYASNHVLIKGALFLALGVETKNAALWMRWLALLLGLALAGLPLTGGALAKLAVKAPLYGGILEVLATVSALGTATLMTHFAWQLSKPGGFRAAESCTRPLVWLASALLALFLPWVFISHAGLDIGVVLSPDSLAQTLWPVVLGLALAIAGQAFLRNLPPVPPGDIIHLVTPGACSWMTALCERLNRSLLSWPVAVAALLVVSLLLTAWFTRS